MSLLLNPWVILGVVLTSMAALFGSYGYGHHKGWNERDAEVQAEVARMNEQSRKVERDLTEQVATQSTKLKEANDAVSKTQSELNRAIRAGRVRLPAPSCVPAAAGAPAAGGDRYEAPTESERETLRLIAEIAADGDRAINQLNACIDAYNEVREALNAKR